MLPAEKPLTILFMVLIFAYPTWSVMHPDHKGYPERWNMYERQAKLPVCSAHYFLNQPGQAPEELSGKQIGLILGDDWPPLVKPRTPGIVLSSGAAVQQLANSLCSKLAPRGPGLTLRYKCSIKGVWDNEESSGPTDTCSSKL